MMTNNPELPRKSRSGVLTQKEKQRLSGEVFRRRNLDGIDLRGANLSGARFENASLRGADLSDANLVDTVFHACDLRQVDFSGAKLGGNCFEHSAIKDAAGLSTDDLAYLLRCGATDNDTVPDVLSVLE